MKILVIDEEFPYPLNTGKRKRTFSLTKTLTNDNVVSYLAYGSPAQDSMKFPESNGITCRAVPPPDCDQYGPSFYWRLFANLFSGLPYIATSHHTERYAGKLRKLVLSTSVEAEGLEVTDGANSVIADDGRQLVEREYRRESLGEKLDPYLGEVVARS